MKTANNSRAKSLRSRSAISEHRKEEIAMVNRAIQECKAKGTSTYITVNGRPYLVTPHGVMSNNEETRKYCLGIVTKAKNELLPILRSPYLP
ncbi:hypothetical protein IQ255_20785 [Pleurocapsales cyanobacterium LEGE 10410]|nr:hypothetical protein [Pleurocapsales cyanobacterium LEGE 10410]